VEAMNLTVALTGASGAAGRKALCVPEDEQAESLTAASLHGGAARRRRNGC
jgi:hypothetical protein